MLTVLSGISELEADMIRERQAEGIALAKKEECTKVDLQSIMQD